MAVPRKRHHRDQLPTIIPKNSIRLRIIFTDPALLTHRHTYHSGGNGATQMIYSAKTWHHLQSPRPTIPHRCERQPRLDSFPRLRRSKGQSRLELHLDPDLVSRHRGQRQMKGTIGDLPSHHSKYHLSVKSRLLPVTTMPDQSNRRRRLRRPRRPSKATSKNHRKQNERTRSLTGNDVQVSRPARPRRVRNHQSSDHLPVSSCYHVAIPSS